MLMMGTVDTPPSLLMSKEEKRKDFFHDHGIQWAGCVTGDACCPVLCFTAVVLRCSGQGDRRARTYQQKQVVLCGCFLHDVSRLNARAQYDLIYVHRVGPMLSSKVGCPFSCMPFIVCLYMKSLTVG